MRSVSAVIVLVAALLGLAPAARAFQNEPTGFRGVAWGTPVGAAHGTLLFDHRIGDRLSYRRSFETLSVDGLPLDALYFDFYQGRFEEAVLVARRHLAGALLQTLTARYGPPAQPPGRRNQFVWLGHTGTVLLRCSTRLVTCTVLIASTAMLQAESDAAPKSAGSADPDF
jgi:hypothetical protein